eukprot:SAG31_NODE_2317_length_5947_cov_2.753591_1_plen_211_part_00
MERLRRVEAQLRGSGRSGRPLRASAPPVATAGDPGYASPQWQEYVAAGLLRAAALNNRFPAADAAAPGTIEGYRKHGFCVLTGCVSRAEVSTIKRDFDALLATAPATNRGTTDRRGRPSPFGGYMGIDAKGRVGIINHPLLMSQSALCCYGHPRILAVVQAINGASRARCSIDRTVRHHCSLKYSSLGAYMSPCARCVPPKRRRGLCPDE